MHDFLLRKTRNVWRIACQGKGSFEKLFMVGSVHLLEGKGPLNLKRNVWIGSLKTLEIASSPGLSPTVKMTAFSLLNNWHDIAK